MPKFLLAYLIIFFSSIAFSSELSRYQNEWCAPNQITQVQLVAIAPTQVCYGTTSFLAQTARAIVLTFQDGRHEFFVEGDFQSVDLMNLEFSVVGPVNKSGGLIKGVGKVRLQVDGNGEVSAVQGRLNNSTSFLAYRSR